MNATQRAQTEAAWRTSQAELNRAIRAFNETDVIAPVERCSVYLQAAYDIGAGIEAYSENVFARRTSDQVACGSCSHSCRGHTLPTRSSPTRSPSILYRVTASAGSRLLSQRLRHPRRLGRQNSDFRRLVVRSVRAAFAYGRLLHERHHLQRPRERDDVGSAPCDPGCSSRLRRSGVAAVRPASTGSAPAVIDDGLFTPEQRAFLFDEETGHTTVYTQSMSTALSPATCELPYGTMAGAVGLRTRAATKSTIRPGPMRAANNLWGQTSAGRTAGEDVCVGSSSAKSRFPLLAGMKFAEDR